MPTQVIPFPYPIFRKKHENWSLNGHFTTYEARTHLILAHWSTLISWFTIRLSESFKATNASPGSTSRKRQRVPSPQTLSKTNIQTKSNWCRLNQTFSEKQKPNKSLYLFCIKCQCTGRHRWCRRTSKSTDIYVVRWTALTRITQQLIKIKKCKKRTPPQTWKVSPDKAGE